MEPHESLSAVSGAGLCGCRHCRAGNDRAVLLMDSETLEALGLRPGQIKENITTRGLPVAALGAGSRLAVGSGGVVLEITGPCHPCRRMDEIRDGLRGALKGRRGQNARVLTGGDIRVGDPITILESAPAAHPS
jgi:MOSC domain-containing protein YiiM